MSVCQKHKDNPVKGYSPCAGCEVERLNNERETLAAENKRLRAANLDCVANFNQMRDELAALKGEQVAAPIKLEIGAYYTSNRGFGRLKYIGETSDIDGLLPTFQAQDGRRKHYSVASLASALVEFAPQQPGQDVAGLVGALEELLAECDPLELNCGEPWCRARAELLAAKGYRCSDCGAVNHDESEHFDHVLGCSAHDKQSGGDV